MQFGIELVIGIGVACLIYNVLHHFLVTVPNQRHQLAVQRGVNREVARAVAHLQTAQGTPLVGKINQARILDAVWGRGIMVFEYRCQLESQLSTTEMQSQLNQVLEQQVRADHFVTETGAPRLVVTDAWIQQQQLYFDVADVANRATQEYVTDLERLDD
ncbi:hypothetical protein M8332_04405 [Fructilactobacillus ixorae]|uniref:Uncharacterized protein n=1 Tax=Fructilactobacillus ixorae TaxID=1750535 RepID=A0ABY5C4A0_9LACO|nr:hypothetical protein [Fructilactobacillus ixorae]USS92879.1 hypothetical protein M8332_04405 [Fructilactobacillus ixorae]